MLGDRTSTLTRFALAWLVLYLVVGTELTFFAPGGRVAAFTDWTGIWMALGIVCAPLCFFLGGRLGTRNQEAVAAVVALLSIGLAVVAIHTTVLKAGAEGMHRSSLPLSVSLLAGAALVYVIVRLLETGTSCGTVAIAGLVLLLISLVITPSFIRCRCQGVTTACKSNLKNIGTALEMYSTDSSGRFPVDLAQLKPSYLKTIPTCPAIGADTYSLSYEQAASPQDAYTVFCLGQNHAEVDMAPDYPMYTSREGLLERRWEERDRAYRPSVPIGHTVRLDETFIVAQVFVFILGMLAAADPRARAVGIGMMLFALIPWSKLIEQDAKPMDDRNACVRNLVVMRRAVEVWRRRHPREGAPTYESLRPVLGSSSPLVCPADETGYADGYVVNADGTVTISCKGSHHLKTGTPPDYPRYVEAERRIRIAP